MTGQQRFAVAAAAIAVTAAAPAVAQDDSALRELIARQQDQIADQKRRLEEQGRKLDQLADRLAAIEKNGGTPPAVAPKDGSGQAVAAKPAQPMPSPTPGQRGAMADAGARLPSDDTRQASTRPAPPGAEQRPAVMADWKTGGPVFASANGFYTFHPRLRLMLDASTTHRSRFGSRNISGTEGRSIFIGGEGRIGGMGYKVETDISSQEVSLREAYLSYACGTGTGVQKQLYVGSKINDRGIDASSADTLTPLMERNAVGVLTAGQRGFFGFGVMGRVLGENWHASVQVSGDSASKEGTSDDTLTVAARAHLSPQLTPDGFLHLGAWAYHERLSDGVASISRSDPVSTRYNDNLHIESGPLVDPQSGTGYGLEGGGYFGRVSCWPNMAIVTSVSTIAPPPISVACR